MATNGSTWSPAAQSNSLAHSSRWTALLVGSMMLTWLVFAAELAFGVLPDDASEPFLKFATCSGFFGAAILCWLKARIAGPERRSWILFGLAIGTWGLGALYFAVVQWDLEEIPFPSPADFFWLVFYIPAAWALIELLRGRMAPGESRVWLDAIVGGLGVGGAIAAIVFQIVLDHTSGDFVAKLTNLAYPIGDVALLGIVVAAITVLGWSARGVWRWIALAITIFVVCDCAYFVLVARGDYVPGSAIDLGWPAAAVMLGLAAWLPEQRVQPRVTQGTITIPAASGVAALVLLVADHFERTNVFALALATASIFVIVIRLYLTVKDNLRILARTKREATTDPLTGLGNRRKLTADVAARINDLDPDRPLMLTLFDLDGFKQYNDTFGHPAGDKLLERLGGRLCQVLEGRGTAYRMGGDEFCALWNLSGPDEASVAVIESAKALSEHGEGFSITCSYGSVLLPNETTDPTDALRLADRRMYIRKGGGRVSAGQQSSEVLLRALAERDEDLGLHIGGVSDLAVQTARRLGLPAEELEAVRLTALLHDVGKVAIPDAILHKPGRLDGEDWEYMKRHTIIGERIISAAPALARVAKYGRSTHERWDGDGYPDGLAGEGIPLVARIVAVSDAYDAMVSRRPYREPATSGEALAELHRCAGTQFDADVVDTFAALVEANSLSAGARR